MKGGAMLLKVIDIFLAVFLVVFVCGCTNGKCNSFGTHDSDGTYNSDGTDIEHGTYKSVGTWGSFGTYKSDGTYQSCGTFESDGIFSSDGTADSMFLFECDGAYKSILCYEMNGISFHILNQQVTDSQVERFKEKLKEILGDWLPYPVNYKEDFRQEKNMLRLLVTGMYLELYHSLWSSLPEYKFIEIIDLIQSCDYLDTIKAVGVFRSLTGFCGNIGGEDSVCSQSVWLDGKE